MRYLCTALLASCLLISALPSAHAEDTVYWSWIGNAVVPTNVAIQNNRYLITGPSIKHASGNQDLITAFAPVPPNDGENNPDRLCMTYNDPDAASTTFVKAQFYRLTNGSGTITSIVTANSETFGNEGGGTVEDCASFSHSLDFLTNTYYVRADLDRNDTTDGALLNAVRLLDGVSFQ